MKKVYLSIITLITVICIIAGACFHIFGHGFKIFQGRHSSGATGKYTDSKEYKVSDIKNIYIDTNVMDITIKNGNTLSASYSCSNEDFIPTFDLESDKLNISQKISSNLFNIGFNDNNYASLTITIPKDASIDILTANSNVGDIDIDAVTANNSSFDLNVGDINVQNSILGECNVTSSTGDVNLENVNFDNMTVDASVGDIDIISSANLDAYDFRINTSVGDIEINDANYSSNYNAKGNNGKSITISASTGDINITY